MLNWEEEIKHSAQVPFNLGFSDSRMAAPPLASHAGHPARDNAIKPERSSAEATASIGSCRFNAADKRITHGKTDLNKAARCL